MKAKNTLYSIVAVFYFSPLLAGIIPHIIHESEAQAEISALPSETQTADEDVEPPSIEPPVEALPEVLESKEDVIKYIHEVFGDAGDEAERVARCESGFRPDAQNNHSTASGVFQIIKGTWHGYNGFDYGTVSWDERYLARKNIEVAYQLYKARGWQPWVCQP